MLTKTKNKDEKKKRVETHVCSICVRAKCRQITHLHTKKELLQRGKIGYEYVNYISFCGNHLNL